MMHKAFCFTIMPDILLLLVSCLCVLVLGQSDNNPPPPVTLTVLESGLRPSQLTDTALVFFVTVGNDGNELIEEINTKDPRCCFYEPLPDGSNNCIKVNLLGDQAFNLQPRYSYILTFIHPTLYIFDRRGQCRVDVEYHISSYPYPQILKHIIFFTSSNPLHFWMPRSLRVWLLGYEDCDSVDHDGLRFCHPVDCALKYQGQRNFYNASSKRCEPLTICMSDDSQSLPTVAFRRRWNTCKDLEKNLTEKDVEFLKGQQPAANYEQHDPMQIYQYVCLHGQARKDHSGCTCERGWTTSEKDYTQTNPDTDMIHMCDTPYLDQVMDFKNKDTQIALIVLGSLCGGLLTIVAALTFFTWWKTQTKPQDFDRDDFETRPLYPATIKMTHLSAENSRSSLHKISQTSLISLKPASHYGSARVHTPNMPLTESELDLRIGDIITDLQETSVPGMWKGVSHGARGTFPVCCAELYQHGQGPTP